MKLIPNLPFASSLFLSREQNLHTTSGCNLNIFLNLWKFYSSCTLIKLWAEGFFLKKLRGHSFSVDWRILDPHAYVKFLRIQLRMVACTRLIPSPTIRITSTAVGLDPESERSALLLGWFRETTTSSTSDANQGRRQFSHGLRIRIRIQSGQRIRIRIGNPDPDPGGQKWPTKVENFF